MKNQHSGMHLAIDIFSVVGNEDTIPKGQSGEVNAP